MNDTKLDAEDIKHEAMIERLAKMSEEQLDLVINNQAKLVAGQNAGLLRAVKESLKNEVTAAQALMAPKPSRYISSFEPEEGQHRISASTVFDSHGISGGGIIHEYGFGKTALGTLSSLAGVGFDKKGNPVGMAGIKDIIDVKRLNKDWLAIPVAQITATYGGNKFSANNMGYLGGVVLVHKSGTSIFAHADGTFDSKPALNVDVSKDLFEVKNWDISATASAGYSLESKSVQLNAGARATDRKSGFNVSAGVASSSLDEFNEVSPNLSVSLPFGGGSALHENTGSKSASEALANVATEMRTRQDAPTQIHEPDSSSIATKRQVSVVNEASRSITSAGEGSHKAAYSLARQHYESKPDNQKEAYLAKLTHITERVLEKKLGVGVNVEWARAITEDQLGLKKLNEGLYFKPDFDVDLNHEKARTVADSSQSNAFEA